MASKIQLKILLFLPTQQAGFLQQVNKCTYLPQTISTLTCVSKGRESTAVPPAEAAFGSASLPAQPESAVLHTDFLSSHLFQGGKDALKERLRTNRRTHSWHNQANNFKALSFQNWNWGTKLFKTIILLPKICKLVQTASEGWPSHLLQEHISEMEASKWQKILFLQPRDVEQTPNAI